VELENELSTTRAKRRRLEEVLEWRRAALIHRCWKFLQILQ
jgi:hypothetical protein